MAVGEKIKVGIVGVSGYAGLELVRILLRHPAVELTYLAGNHESEGPISQEFPHLLNRTSLPVKKYGLAECKNACDFVFVALPAGASGEIASQLWQEGKQVIDLSGDLRLPKELYEKWYHKPALPPSIQQKAVDGLPEWNRKQIAEATLISNPGCYPTSALLGLLPIFRANAVKPGSTIIVDAKSGVSGAGRAARQNLQFGELTNNFYAYKVGQHQHTPEIEYQLGSKANSKIVFTAHLLPLIRGIFSSMYVELCSDVTEEYIYHLFKDAYGNAPFVKVLPYGQVPELKSVAGSNDCVLGIQFDERTGMLQIFSVIDNLQKGASGQAVQNMNIMLGLYEALGLEAIPFIP